MYNKVIEILNKAVVKNIKVYDMKNLTPFYDYSIMLKDILNILKRCKKDVDFLIKVDL